MEKERIVEKEVMCLGWWGVSPEQVETTRQRIRRVAEEAKRLGVEVYVTKANPMRPLDVKNPDVLIARGPESKVNALIRSL